KIREAMKAWLDGLGPLARLLDLVDSDGGLRPLGVTVGSDQILASWYRGYEHIDLVVDLNTMADKFREAGRFTWRSGPPASEPGWAWHWTLSELQHGLKAIIEREDL